MTAMWFGLAAIALVGAIVLLYFDRIHRQRTGHMRQTWAKSQGYTYVSVEPALASTWRRGALAKLGYLTAVDVVSGMRKGEKFVLFDLEDSATLIAVRRQIGSDIDIDMRLKTASPPKDADLELLGAIGDRVVFATNPEIARHAVDQRMVAFIEGLPDTVHMLWSEGNWTLGMLPVGASSRDWEAAIDTVLRLSGLLHVLPPVSDTRGTEVGGHDPGRPRPPAQPAIDDPRGVEEVYEDYSDRGDYAAEPVDRGIGRDAPLIFPDDEPDDFAPLPDIPEEEEPPRRPSLAVVPDIRTRVRRNWPPAEEDDWPAEEDRYLAARRERAAEDELAVSGPAPIPEDRDEEPAQPGGPFHPGFRPYQGPASR